MLTLLIGALVVALIALGTVFYFQFSGDEAEEQAAQETRPALYRIQDSQDSNMNAVLSSREDDTRPLNEGELFERHNSEISGQSLDFTLRDSDLTDDCAAAVWGDQVQQALADADCTQAGRATYISDDVFGVVAVFNLADLEGSRAVAQALELPETEEGEEPTDPGFVLSPSGSDPFDRLGGGYSAADAIITGHYLVVAWVQPTDSESVEERVSLVAPLVTLANFRNPFFRRIGELTGGEGTGTEEGAEEGTEEELVEDPPLEDPPPAEEPIEEPVVPGE